MSAEIEKLAKEMRFMIRMKAGLNADWDNASEGIKNWYRELARRSLEIK